MDGFVGRQAELRLLEFALEAASRGSGRLLTITGPPGVGKTRLCEEAADRARATGHTVVWGRCWTDGGAPALWPWQSILARLCGDDATALLDGAAGTESVGLRRLSRFVAVGERLARACASSPTLLIIDDSHAADPGALLLTQFVARNLHHLPLVLVLTQRPGAAPPEAAPLLAEVERDGVPIVLGSFTIAETRAFLVSHGVRHRDPAFVEAVHAVSEGSPLYLRRLIALEAARAGAAPPHGLPGVIEQSLRPLRPLTVRLLTQSAILGRSVAVAEAATLAGASETDVRAILPEASGSGLVTLASPDTFTFTHDLVRQALAAHLTHDERLAAHARAADIVKAAIGPDADDRLGRLAHHALQAAPRSADDARAAVAACHAAARSMVRHFAYEQAMSLLAAAAGLHDDPAGELGPAPAQLLLDWAHVVLSCGCLTDAGPLFDRAADAARRERDPLVFAEAALGVGGMWVNKYRGRADRARVLARLEEALAWVPEAETVLRCRLATRQAAELAYEGGTTAAVLTALEDARRIDDRQALAEALSLSHHALLNPRHGEQRLGLADELVGVASAAGLEILTLVGVCRRTIDLFQLGDPRAERSMTDLRRRAELLSCRGVLFIHAAMEVMLLIRAGELTRAEERAVACFRIGTEVGDADAPIYHSAHLFAIRWLQGRGGELVDLAERMANSPALPDAELTFHATLALLAADAGDLDRARSALHRLTAGGLTAIPVSSTWLACMYAVVEVTAALTEPDLAKQAYDLLEPFAHLPVVPSMAIVCFGSVERSLGLAALTFGDTARAVEHLERAVTANLRLANRPLTAYARANLAEALRRRGEVTRAGELLDLAITAAADMGMTGKADAWRATRRELASAITISRAGERWQLTYQERDVLVDDLVGMRYLAQLVAHPGTEIAALDLVADSAGPGSEPTNHAVIDDAARAAYARRARELARVEWLEQELDALTEAVARDTGLGGRTRNFAGPAERARTAVRKAITRAIDAIGDKEPEAAATLRAAVTTGYRCVYQPAR